MHENVFRIHKRHIEKFLGRIKNDIYGETIPLQAEYGISKDPVKFRDRLKLKYEKIKEGELWGETWDSAWFHLQAIVPETWKDKETALYLNLSGESMLFDGKGVPVCAFSAGYAFAFVHFHL